MQYIFYIAAHLRERREAAPEVSWFSETRGRLPFLIIIQWLIILKELFNLFFFWRFKTSCITRCERSLLSFVIPPRPPSHPTKGIPWSLSLDTHGLNVYQWFKLYYCYLLSWKAEALISCFVVSLRESGQSWISIFALFKNWCVTNSLEHKECVAFVKRALSFKRGACGALCREYNTRWINSSSSKHFLFIYLFIFTYSQS